MPCTPFRSEGREPPNETKGTDPRFVGANQADKRGKWKATTTMRPVRRHTAQGGGR